MTPAIVTPGQPLRPPQKVGLELVAHLHGGRDVVLAIDVTESVGLNDKGRTHLRQIVEDSLKPGDSVYVVPFASDVGALVTPILGITISLWTLSQTICQTNASDVSSLVRELQQPLQGMGIAFITSLIGLSFSAVLTVFNFINNTGLEKYKVISSL